MNADTDARFWFKASAKRTFEDRRLKAHGLVLGSLSTLGTATQLRSPGGVGPAELLLVGFILSTWFSTHTSLSVRFNSRALNVLLLLALCSTLGAFAASFIFDREILEIVSGLLILYFLLLIALYVIRQERPEVLLRSWARTFGISFLSTQFAILVLAQRGQKIGFISPMWFDVRFQGWTSNPNQLAFMTVIAATALVHSGRSHPLARFAWLSVALLLGLASLSDGFQLALLISIATSLFFSVTSAQRSSEPRIRLMAWTALLLACLSVAVVWFQLFERATEVARAGNQGSDRLALWGACIRSIVQSPVTGLGPGSHAIGTRLGHPMECHNSMLDVAASAGLVAATAMMALFWSLARRAWRQADRLTLFALVQISVMALFGYLLRYPQLWLVLLLLEQHLSGRAKESSTTNPVAVQGFGR